MKCPRKTLGICKGTLSSPPLQAFCTHQVQSKTGGELALPDRTANSRDAKTKKKKEKLPSHTGTLQQVEENKPNPQCQPSRLSSSPRTGSHKAGTKQTHTAPWNTLHLQHLVLKRTTLRLKRTTSKLILGKLYQFFYTISPNLPIFACSPGLSEAHKAERSEGNIFTPAQQQHNPAHSQESAACKMEKLLGSDTQNSID